MRRVIVLLAVIVLGVTYSVSSLAALTFCNKTPVKLSTAVGYQENGAWHSKGWYTTQPSECTSPFTGNLRSRFYYHYTKNVRAKLAWEGEYAFCTDSAAFDLRRDPSCSYGGERKHGFKKIDTGDYSDYTLNLTCADCSNPSFNYESVAKRLDVYYNHVETVGTTGVSFPATGAFKFRHSERALQVSMQLTIDLSGLQKELSAVLSPQINSSDECGDRVKLRRASLTPQSRGSAGLSIKIDYERWYCTYMDVPEFRGLEVRMKTRRTSKNKVIESGLDGRITLTPHASRTRIYVSSEVTSVRVRNDLARFVLDTFNYDLKDMAQHELNRTLGPNGAISGIIPKAVRPYAKISSARFLDSGNGNLQILLEGAFKVDKPNAEKICRKLSGRNNC